ncbi:MAG TPA: hypothetical protein VN652_07225 [Geobacteraceae bacterium]|nr:hypothetical protein [Geobacteraceae bacterium]
MKKFGKLPLHLGSRMAPVIESVVVSRIERKRPGLQGVTLP